MKGIAKVLSITPVVCLGALVGRMAMVPNAEASPRGDEGGVAGIGPDVIVGMISDLFNFGAVGPIAAYGIGTVSCNLGDQELKWCSNNVSGFCTNTQHPVIAQNMYRLKNGRLEQIGMSWVKHGFCALDGGLCGSCIASSMGCSALGVGCSDPYSGSLNGVQSLLGPRSQINPVTGIFPYPFTAPPAGGALGRRVQVPLSALDPTLNSGALFFAEGHYIAADDAAAGNANNNASYRRFSVGDLAANGAYTLSMQESTFTQTHAIYAWRDHGLGIGVPDPSVHIQTLDIEDDGRFIIGSKVTDNGNGTWSYEYAIFNQNSDRAARGWRVARPDGVTVTAQDQNIVNHHSGEPYSTLPWTMTLASEAILWATEAFDVNANANALRWSTMFNFRFVADTPPVAGSAVLELFKSGVASDPVVSVPVPSAPILLCPADLNNDGFVNGADLAIILGAWGTTGPGDLNNDGVVNGADIAIVLGAWGDC
ncbi:MAG: hypothetical protein KF724_10005 [Phycisphaeraceae bacterium]|nr:hypothetical protein [Phycisphaeraceae bacterium]